MLAARDAVVGLGANLGDRLAALRGARAAFAARCDVRAESAVYETEPVGPPQPGYLNAALLLRWSGSARALLVACLDIEQAHGRERRERWGPRTLDLDVLWIDGEVIDEPELRVPHPRLCERWFALAPLFDVVPAPVDPRTGRVLAPLAPPFGVRRLDGATLS
jgi:2-amino-4-hydroxy-6-hydroxymethyldihydropteridine diphosphokinase